MPKFYFFIQQNKIWFLKKWKLHKENVITCAVLKKIENKHLFSDINFSVCHFIFFRYHF